MSISSPHRLPSPPSMLLSQWGSLSGSLPWIALNVHQEASSISSRLILFWQIIESALLIWFCIIYESTYMCIHIELIHIDTMIHTYCMDSLLTLYRLDYYEPCNKGTSVWWTKEKSLQRKDSWKANIRVSFDHLLDISSSAASSSLYFY